VEIDPQPIAETATVAPNPGSMAMGTNPTTNTRLTEEQSELVQGMIRHHIPLVTVVGVVEGMLRREGPGASGVENSGSRVAQSDGRLEAANPPDYDFV
jgi:hypothetical protein